MSSMIPVLIALGSNIDAERNLGEAVFRLGRHPGIKLDAVSSMYASAPIGASANQPAYLNAAVLVETGLDPRSLKLALRGIEEAMGRVRVEDKHAPRPIDLDIACYGQQAFDLDGSPIPDPQILRYPHIAVPLAEIAPHWVFPEQAGRRRTLRQIADTMRYTDEELHMLTDRQLTVLSTDGHYAGDLDARAGEVYDPQFESLVEQMLARVGEDPDREGLRRTPLRVAKAMDFLTSGYSTTLEEIVNEAIFQDCCQEMVIVKDIEFYSLCEHHMLPFFGRAHVAYVPDGRIIGLSKVARVVDMFARRLQVQERITNQIADAMMQVLTPLGVGVVLEASHFCMMMRGVGKQNSATVTSAMRGSFQDDPRTRAEFLQLLQQ
jgi:GTP cyclohydrolase IA